MKRSKEVSSEETLEFTRRLEIEDLGSIDGGHVLEVELGPLHMSRAGIAHGGLLFTMLDAALARAIADELPPGIGSPTVEIKINYFRPVGAGKVRARGEVVRRGRTLCYAEGEIRDAAGELVARATGTFFLKAGKPSE